MIASQETVAFGQGYAPGTNVELWIHSTPVYLRSVTAGADGTFSATIRIPSDATPGQHAIVSVGIDPADETLELSAPITVVAATMPPTTTVGAAPIQGSAPLLPMVLVLLLSVVGSATASLVYIDRRQRR